MLAAVAISVWLANPAFGQGQPGDRLPNLRALPASELSVYKPTLATTALRFATISSNTGEGPFELRVGDPRPGGDGLVYDAFQRIYNTNGGFRDVLVGTLSYHSGHNHIHFDGYADYILKPLSSPGASDRTSAKTSFCIMDTTKVDPRLPGAPKKPVYSTCSPDVQGMSIGWGDRYGPTLIGQSIDLTNLQDGLFELTIKIDPQNRLVEISDADNASCLLLQIGVSNLTVQPLGPCGTTSGGDVTIASIAPNSSWAGTVTNVTIKGSNFTSGIAVGFENGSGPAPVASDVIVHDTSTITAVVTVKNGGGSNDSVWDLRVGSAVLPGGFTVLR